MEVIKKLAFQDIENIPAMIKDFLDGNIEGFDAAAFSEENFSGIIDAKKTVFNSRKRTLLKNALQNQLKNLNLTDVQLSNLSLLENDTTFTVTTGHQLNLFSGPVFSVYKILQTIKTAAYLSEKFPENHFIPVFWMATEDHDFEEISHFRTSENFYEIHEKHGGAVGRIALTHNDFIREFEEEFKDSVYGTELILLLKEAYQISNSLTEATRILTQRLFGDLGLLMIDGDDASLKKEMTEIFKDELLNSSLKNTTAETVQALTSKYGKVQVNPREINLFYLSETRNRIEKAGEKFKVVDTDKIFSEEEILNQLENHPENFSPNALMRPVYQETILPNVAYIGGNAEIMYWLELKAYYGHLGLPFPILIPRNSLLLISRKNLEKMDKLGLLPEDFFRNFATLTSRKLLEGNEIEQLLEAGEARLRKNFSELKDAAEKTEKSFGNLVNAEEARQLKSFQRMKKRLLRAEKIKNRELLERLESLFLQIHPAKNWQERVFNFSVFYADRGEAWLKYCLQEMSVNRAELIIIAD